MGLSEARHWWKRDPRRVWVPTIKQMANGRFWELENYSLSWVNTHEPTQAPTEFQNNGHTDGPGQTHWIFKKKKKTVTHEYG